MAPRLRALAVRWMLWAAINRVGQDALRLGGRLVLARLLWPDAFGLFTLAMVVVATIKAGCQLEFSKPIVQRESPSAELLSTAFWSQTALGATGTLALAALAGPLGLLTGQSQVAALLQVLAVQVLLGGVSVVPRAWLWREGAFRQMANRALLAEAVGAVAAVTTAMAGGGVWSFVVQELVSDVVALFVLWAIVPWRPRLHWASAEFSELFRFGWPLLGKRGLDLVSQEGDRFLVGRIFGPDALGLYALALRVVEALARSIGTVFERVAFPAFARTQDDPRRSRLGFLEAVRFQAVLTFPPLIGVALLAGDLVPFVLGPHWAGAVPLTGVLAARALVSALLILPGAVLLGRGRPWHILALGLCSVGAFALGWMLGLPWGPLGVATGGLVAAAVLVPIALRLVTAELGIPIRDWGRALLPAAIGGAAMAVGIGVTRWLLPGTGSEGRTLRLGAALLVGAISYGLPLAPWLAGETRRYLALLRQGKASRGAAQAPFPPRGMD